MHLGFTSVILLLSNDKNKRSKIVTIIEVFHVKFTHIVWKQLNEKCIFWESRIGALFVQYWLPNSFEEILANEKYLWTDYTRSSFSQQSNTQHATRQCWSPRQSQTLWNQDILHWWWVVAGIILIAFSNWPSDKVVPAIYCNVTDVINWVKKQIEKIPIHLKRNKQCTKKITKGMYIYLTMPLAHFCAFAHNSIISFESPFSRLHCLTRFHLSEHPFA